MTHMILTAQQCSSSKGDTDYSIHPDKYDNAKIRLLIMEGSSEDIEKCIQLAQDTKILQQFWMAAVLFGKIEAIALLYEKFHVTTLEVSQAVTQKEYEILSYVLEKGFDINSDNGLLLFCAFFHDDKDMQHFLIDNGAEYAPFEKRYLDEFTTWQKIKQSEQIHLKEYYLARISYESLDNLLTAPNTDKPKHKI